MPVDGVGTPAIEAGAAAGLVAGKAGRVALRTVQAVVEQAVREVVREPVELLGASRTDSGVHAKGQVGAFSCGGKAQRGEGERDGEVGLRGGGWPLERGVVGLRRAVNSRLPDDVQVVGIEVVDDSFHPIADCVSKGYSYTLHVSLDRPLWDQRFVHHVWVPLDVERMQAAAALIVGEHDFAAFAAAGHGRLSTVREVYECRVEGKARRHEGTEARRGGGDWEGENGEGAQRVRIYVSGNGFLYNMVRIIAGTLVEVGKGRMGPEDVVRVIESGDRRNAGPTLPAQGLCLEWVEYGEGEGTKAQRHEGTEGEMGKEAEGEGGLPLL